MQGSVQDLQDVIEAGLLAHLPQSGLAGVRPLDEALRFAVFPGGKRLRPVLALLGARVFGGDLREALSAACAVEFIHTSSLILDDLPCMDDAAIRRGLPALHCKFGEEVALLAAIALLNQAYAIFGRTPALIAQATECIGMEGMIGGQALDLTPHDASEEAPAERARKLAERNRKTSAMMRLALTAGALACGTSQAEVAALGDAGQDLGEAYQIGDDLLDVRHSSKQTGKNAGQDGRHRRPSHGLLDEQACLDHMGELIAKAQRTLRETYGAARVAELMTLIDAAFAGLLATHSASESR